MRSAASANERASYGRVAAGALSPAVSGYEIRITVIGPQDLGAFTIGDQLLWGAAEPLRIIQAQSRP